ncbi:hypothetical protein [Alkalihalobacillus trypoxylicola]|uniref:Multi antimicrobial extrusion protein MatE n=1 Tax=Alkalihalobacillus trypoxylicola TaxID=519424 RepID=A0A161Q1A3_9BACI|nr:hypothetical protein [Alkalihalobacillus trypoxylicola]KYG34811.1 multi antimicrobial extrusion protein MatE [Alkalihalobacillus trypoxylicola]
MKENEEENQLTTKQMLLFFIPLGLSASLVMISHLIINGTLARGDDPESIIASYALAMSLFAITERLGVLLRHTCSALVRDQLTFNSMQRVSMYVIATLLLLTAIIAFTPVGPFIFIHLFGAEIQLVEQIVSVYQLLIFVTFFSAIRCLYQGVIIINKKTKWLTIGMIIRLIGMYIFSLIFIHFGTINATTGAWIFLVGMIIESAVSYWEGKSLVKKLPVKEEKTTKNQSQIFVFYRPLILSSLIIVMIGPMINIFLGKTAQIELAIASFALALSIAQLLISFFSYIHQIVLSYYQKDSQKVKQFLMMIGFIPTLILLLLSYTNLGPFLIENILGATGELLTATIMSLRVFVILVLVFPFIDFCNGLLLLKGQTKVMVFTQSSNVITALVILLVLSFYFPHWNGMIGAFAQSIGMGVELVVLLIFLKRKKVQLLMKEKLRPLNRKG